MSEISAVFRQSPSESKRYLLDYSLDLDPGEVVSAVAVTVFPSASAPVSPPLVCTSVLVSPNGLQVVYYISGGVDGFSYEVQFIATTSLTKRLEDVVQYNVKAKV